MKQRHGIAIGLLLGSIPLIALASNSLRVAAGAAATLCILFGMAFACFEEPKR